MPRSEGLPGCSWASSTTAPAPSPNSTQVAAIGPIQNSRKCFRADHQRALEGARAQEIVGGGQRKHEPGTDRLKIEGRAVSDAEPVLHRDRRRRKRIVRRRRRQHDQVDRLRIDAGMSQRSIRRMDGEM